MKVSGTVNRTHPSSTPKTYVLLDVPGGWYQWTVNCSDGVHNVYPNAANAPRGYWMFYVNAP